MPLILVSPYLRKVIADLFPPLPSGPTDPYIDYVTFLMHANADPAIESAVNILYQDAKGGSDYTFVGAPTAGVGKFGTGVRFGKTGYMRTVSRPFANLGKSDFTFEFFVRIQELGGIGDHDYVAFDLPPLQGGMHSDKKFYFTNYGSWATLVSNIELKTNGEQVHVAIARASGTTRMFFDGQVVATTASLNNVDLSQTADFFIGARAGGANYTNTGSYDIDELRLTCGVARYTANFTPPTVQHDDMFIDPQWNQVTALLPMNSDLLDAKGNVVSGFGNTLLSTAKAKFGSKSAYFDGNGDYLTMPQAVGQFRTGDFTIEGWVHPETFTTPDSSGAGTLCSQYAGAGLRWIFNMNAQGTHFTTQTEGGSTPCSNPKVVAFNKWTHIAVVRKAGVITVYVNGTPGPAVNNATDLNIAAPVGVGRFINASIPYLEQFKGFMQDVRITKFARYTKAFAVPTKPHRAHDFKVGLQIRMQGNSSAGTGPTTFKDDFGRSVNMYDATNAVILIDGGRLGTCANFTGVSALTVVENAHLNTDFVIGTADYTISGYAYLTAHNNALRTFVSTAHENDYHGFFLGLSATNCLMACEGSSGVSPWQSGNKVAPNTFPLNTWVKYELKRIAGVSILLMDDVEQLRWNSNYNLTNPNNKLAIGARYIGNAWSQAFVGKMDDVRFYRK